MTETQRTVADVIVIQTAPEGPQAKWQFIYAPGAGSNVNDPFGTYACQALAAHGIPAARFQFPYQEAHSRRPDRPVVLQDTWRAVLDAVRHPDTNVVIGGRSMGGRVATLIVAAKSAGATGLAAIPADIAGLVAFAYPLHQPGHPEKARVAHLADIQVPTLFLSGTRDAFGTPEEMANAAAQIEGAKLHFLEGADHGFAVLKRSGRTKEEIYQEAVAELLTFVQERGIA
jgi:predicted alpha/beta-hydrolase family hydrolase